MLNMSRLLVSIVVAVAVGLHALIPEGPVAANPDVPRVTDCGDGVDGSACRGGQEGSSGTKNAPGPVYSGPTRQELGYQRCEESVPDGPERADYLSVCKMMVDARIVPWGTPKTAGTAAREAVAVLGIQPPRIGMTPRPGPDSVALVGYNVWLWVDSPDALTFGPATATASIDEWTFGLTGYVESVEWDMGDGNVVRCAGPGTPYVVDRDGLGPSPDCGHVYTEQGEFTVTATAHWRVDWTTSDGTQSGAFTADRVSTVPVTVGEWQVLVTRGDGR